jgi:prepilin-type N-terminal cleavage/methylation domain-containing protein
MIKIPVLKNHVRKISKHGFTIFEILIGIVIIGTALIAAVEMFITASKGSEQAENIAVAMNLAQERIEQVKILVKQGVDVSVGTGSNAGDTFLPDLTNVNISSYLSGNLYLTESNFYGSASASLSKMNPLRRVDRITQVSWEAGVDTYKKVQVTVFWQEKGEIKSCGLVTLIRE